MNPLSIFEAMPASESGSGNINWTDVKKVIRLALVGALGVFVVNLSTSLSGVDFGAYKPLADLAGVVLAELGRRLVVSQ